MLIWILIIVINWWFGRLLVKHSSKSSAFIGAILLSTVIIGIINYATIKYMASYLNIADNLVAQNIVITSAMSLFFGGIICWGSILYHRRKALTNL